jgi:hypothetical protein
VEHLIGGLVPQLRASPYPAAQSWTTCAHPDWSPRELRRKGGAIEQAIHTLTAQFGRAMIVDGGVTARAR